MLRNTKSGRNENRFSFIDEAYRSFKKKKFDNTVIILERAYTTGENTPYSMFLLALSLIYTNNFSRAGVILENIQRIDPLYEPFLQLKSFLSLKSALSREEAMNIYVSALEKLPADKMLRKALGIIEDTKDFTVFQKHVKLDELVNIPSPRKKRDTFRFSGVRRTASVSEKRGKLRRKVYFTVFLFSVALFTASLIFFNSFKEVFTGKNFTERVSDISGKVDMVDLGGAGYGIINRINSEKTLEFYSSSDMVLNDFNEARRLLKKGDFNRGIIILNRIISSNASFMVKEKCEFLIKYVMDSDERVYEEIDVVRLNEKPHLYRGSSVKISGKVTNIKQIKDGKSFTLIVGYDGKKFKGIALVFDPRGIPVVNGDEVEVKGLFITGMGRENVPYVSGEEIKKI